MNMREPEGPTMVPSADGTPIAYWSSGAGPPLLLVHGGLGDHTRWDALRPHLEAHVRVHAMDRRGRGGSGDHDEYAIEREFEDVAAVVEAISEETDTPVDVYGSSYGGLCAFGAAGRTWSMRRLALYEGWPPVDPEALAPHTDVLAEIDALLAAGDRESALVTAYREYVGLGQEEIDAIRAKPSWPARVAAAHTLPREARAFARSPFDPERAGGVALPTLLIIGSESPLWGPDADTIAAALPDARITVLDGQGHVADLFAPARVAEALLPFLQGPDADVRASR